MRLVRLALLVVAATLLSSCIGGAHGPWLDASGRELMGSEVVEFEGFPECDQRRVVFLRFFGDQYAKDPQGQLGELRSPESGEPISFEILEELPSGAEATGIHHAGREIFVADDRAEYLYIRHPNGSVERWPRAEASCERTG